MNKSLYRKYQPINFKEIVGQNLIKTILLNSINQKRISHAYIFSGPHGIGKTSTSRIFSKAINCLSYKNDCCNDCSNCNAINNNDTSDIVELDAASNNGVSDIREMINNINYLPHIFKRKIYIIDEVQMLSSSAWNALLKTIENPPKHVIFIFATTELNKIPLTIISRCQKFDFNRINQIEINEVLKKVIQKENFKVSKEALDVLSQIANGSMRDALSMLDQIANSSGESEILASDVEILFGLTSIDTKIKIIDNIVRKNFSKLISIFNNLEMRGANFSTLAKEILELLIDKIIYIKTNSCKDLKKLSEINVNNFEINISILYSMVEIFQDGLNDIKNNFDERFFFEIIIWKSIKLFDTDNFVNDHLHEKNLQDTPFNNPETHLPLSIEKLEEKISFIENKMDLNILNKNEETIIFKTTTSNIDDNINKNIILEDVLNVRKIVDLEKKDNFYKLTPISFTPNKIKKIEILQEENPKKDTKEIFFRIAKNKDNNNKIELNNLFKQINSNIQISPFKGFISNAINILIASKKGFVFLFDDKLSAQNLNDVSESKDFLLYIKEEFKKIYCIIGVAKSDAREFSKEYKELLKKKISFEDCDIDSIEKLVEKNKTTEDIALDIFKEELSGE